jgi:hypothetical protein
MGDMGDIFPDWHIPVKEYNGFAHIGKHFPVRRIKPMSKGGIIE